MTHTPDYYNPIFDVPIDHGTVCFSIIYERLVFITLLES